MRKDCIIVDDEPLAISLLKQYVEGTPSLHLKQTFGDPVAAFSYLQQNKVDIIFLDIEMPHLKGLDFIRSLPYKPDVIIVSAYREYAADGFNLNVSDYMVKPVTFSRFLQGISKITGEKIADGSIKTPVDEVLYFKVDKKIIRLYLEDIYYIESCKDYIKVFSKEKSFITYQNMTGIEEFLPKTTFLRIHRAYIINTAYIEYLEGNILKVANALLPIGKFYKNALVELIRNKNQYASKSKIG